MKFVAFLKGINVGGHHKVPMADLKVELKKLGFSNVITILNSGNVIFNSNYVDEKELEQSLSAHLEKTFGFPIPTLIRNLDVINDLLVNNPFEGIEETKENRFYLSFLPEEKEAEIDIPWESEDDSFQILEKRERTIISILDLSKSKTPKAMEVLEKFYGKGITTRNWNTLKRIEKKIQL